MKYKNILWDWNGTLLDDVGISIDCVNVLLEKLKKEPTDLKEYYQMMEIPLQKYYENLFNSRKMQFEYKLCTANFQETYPKFIDNASLMNGAKEMLEFFKEQGCKQFIVSSFEKNYLTEYVNKFGVADYFEEISGDDDIHCAPKSQRALDLVKDVDKKEILYIGDTQADVITANDVGCECILICKGHQPREVLEKTGCVVVDDLIEIKKYL